MRKVESEKRIRGGTPSPDAAFLASENGNCSDQNLWDVGEWGEGFLSVEANLSSFLNIKSQSMVYVKVNSDGNDMTQKNLKQTYSIKKS